MDIEPNSPGLGVTVKASHPVSAHIASQFSVRFFGMGLLGSMDVVRLQLVSDHANKSFKE